MSLARAPNPLTTPEELIRFIAGLDPSIRSIAYTLIEQNNFAALETQVVIPANGKLGKLSNTTKKRLRSHAIGALEQLRKVNTLGAVLSDVAQLPLHVGDYGGIPTRVSLTSALEPTARTTPIRREPVALRDLLGNDDSPNNGTTVVAVDPTPTGALLPEVVIHQETEDAMSTTPPRDLATAEAATTVRMQTIEINGMKTEVPYDDPLAVKYRAKMAAMLDAIDPDAPAHTTTTHSDPLCGRRSSHPTKPASVQIKEWTNALFSPIVLLALVVATVYGVTYLFFGNEQAKALEAAANKLVAGRPWFWIVITGLYSVVMTVLLKVFPESIGRGMLIVMGGFAILGATVWLIVPTVLPLGPSLVILALAMFLAKHVVDFLWFSTRAILEVGEGLIFTTVQLATVLALTAIRLSLMPMFLETHEARYQSLRAWMSDAWGIGWLLHVIDSRSFVTGLRLTHQSKVPTEEKLGKDVTKGQWAVAGTAALATLTWLWVIPLMVVLFAASASTPEQEEGTPEDPNAAQVQTVNGSR